MKILKGVNNRADHRQGNEMVGNHIIRPTTMLKRPFLRSSTLTEEELDQRLKNSGGQNSVQPFL